MKIIDLCNIIQDTSKITITPLFDETAFEFFCNTWKFHDEQKHLQPKILKQMLHMLPSDKILFYLDCYQIYFSFIWLDNIPVAIGPYCSKLLTENNYKTLVQQNNLQGLPAKDVLTYRSQFSVVADNYIIHLVQCLDKYASKEILNRTTLYLDINIHKHKTLDEDNIAYKSHASLVQERYKKEFELMESIRLGKRNEALKKWRELHNAVDYLKRTIGYTLETAKISAAVTRTAIRIAGTQAGLPAELSDLMTSQSSKVVRHAKNIEEINTEHERLIQAYCNAIHSFRTENYSCLVLSCIYHIETLYQNEIIISDLAQELDVSVNHLITQFRKETGTTPGQFLKQVRLKQAAWLLSSSNLSVQDICTQVGIQDANYFSKQFRITYHETPREYGRKHKL